MRWDWEPEDLIACWTLIDEDWRLIANKAGATRLGFALLLKFFELEARFPRHPGELPSAAVDYVAEQVKVPAVAFADYDWEGRALKYHRAQIRSAHGFREATREDEDRLGSWLAEEVCPVELNEGRLREALMIRCRAERMEPPGRIDRILGAAQAAVEQRFCVDTLTRLPEEAAARLEDLVAEDAGDDESSRPECGGPRLLAELKADPGQLGLETLMREVEKLGLLGSLGLPADLFAGASEKLVVVWRARAAKLYPSHLRVSPRPVRLTLLASLCWVRAAEITDSLVDLLIGLVHKINAKAERRIEGELIRDLKRVRGKEGILFRIAEVSVDHPDDTVRAVIFPVAGEATLRDLIREARANEYAFRQRVRTVLSSSYSLVELLLSPFSAWSWSSVPGPV